MDARWRMLAILFIARGTMGFQLQSVASTSPFLIEHLNIGYAEVGTLIGVYMLAGVVLALPAGLIGQRFGDKTLSTAGLGLMALGGFIMGLGDTYAMAFAGRLISGAGSVLLSLVVTKMVTDWFAGREIVTAMGITLASWPFSIAVALMVQGSLAAAFGWRSVMYTAAAYCVLALILVLLLYRAPSKERPSDAPHTLAPTWALPPWREALPSIVAGVIWGVYNLGFLLFFSFVPLLLIDQGLSPSGAASITSMALWVMILSLPLGGYLVQRSGRPDAAILIFAVVNAVALVSLPLFPALALVFCLVLGIGIGPPAGAIMAMPARALSPENRAVGIGLFMVWYNILNVFGPGLAGYLREVFGPTAPVLLASAMFLLVTSLVPLFHVLATRAKTG